MFYRKIHIFLRKACVCCLSFYVCQMFEQSVGAGRGESQHIQGIFVVSLTWVHLYNVMSHIDCLSRRTCDEFRCGSCNIIYKSPTSRETEKTLRVALPRNSIPRIVEAVARHKNIQQRDFLGLWNFLMKNRSTPTEYEGIYL